MKLHRCSRALAPCSWLVQSAASILSDFDCRIESNQIDDTQLDNEKVRSQDRVGSTAWRWSYAVIKKTKQTSDTKRPRRSGTEWRTVRLAEVTVLIVPLGWPSLASLVIGACSVITGLSRETPCSPGRRRSLSLSPSVFVHLKRRTGPERPSTPHCFLGSDRWIWVERTRTRPYSSAKIRGAVWMDIIVCRRWRLHSTPDAAMRVLNRDESRRATTRPPFFPFFDSCNSLMLFFL